MEIHGQHAVGAGGGEHVGHQLGGDGIAALGLTILTGIAEIGDHRGNTTRGGALAGVDHDEQLHQAVIDRLAGGVDEKHIAAADALIQRDRGLAVRKGFDLCLAQLDADELADLLCQCGVGVAGEDLDVLAVRNHDVKPLAFCPLWNIFSTAAGHGIPVKKQTKSAATSPLPPVKAVFCDTDGARFGRGSAHTAAIGFYTVQPIHWPFLPSAWFACSYYNRLYGKIQYFSHFFWQ